MLSKSYQNDIDKNIKTELSLCYHKDNKGVQKKMKKQYLLRIPKNIKENLKKYGDEKGVSLNAVILSAIDDYIEKKGIK